MAWLAVNSWGCEEVFHNCPERTENRYWQDNIVYWEIRAHTTCADDYSIELPKGDQMGLGKPWEPDWLNTEQDKFVLYTHNNVICLNRFVLGHNVLAFPTAEIRDAFYENFEDLIELVKELL